MPQTASIGPFAARNRGAMSQVPAASACSFPKATGNPPQLQIGARERGRRKFLNQRVARAVRVPGSKHEARVAGDESRTRAPNTASDCGAASSNPSAPRSLHPALRISPRSPPTCSPCFPALPALPAPCTPRPLPPCFVHPTRSAGRQGTRDAVRSGNRKSGMQGFRDSRRQASRGLGRSSLTRGSLPLRIPHQSVPHPRLRAQHLRPCRVVLQLVPQLRHVDA